MLKLQQSLSSSTAVEAETDREEPQTITNRRVYKRVRTAIPGTFCSPSTADAQGCVVTDISLGGARIECAEAPPVGAQIVLHADGFDEMPAAVVRTTPHGVGICFDCTPEARERLAAKIMAYVGGDRRGQPRTLRDEHLEAATYHRFTRSDGSAVDFEVIDLSLSGAALATEIKPPVGEVITIGKSRGRVARHFENGIAVEFVSSARG
jgi:hypothetical protein